MKRQRNIHQVKEYDKCTPNQTKEEEIGSLSEKAFRKIIDKYDPIAIYVVVLGSSLYTLFVFPV